MPYVNVGATVNGQRPMTKKALREAIANAPDSVQFDQTSMFATGGKYLRVTDIVPGMTLSVVGPDPYRKRAWYASITRNGAKVTVK